jgi:hypothetical protein
VYAINFHSLVGRTCLEMNYLSWAHTAKQVCSLHIACIGEQELENMAHRPCDATRLYTRFLVRSRKSRYLEQYVAALVLNRLARLAVLT